MNKNHFGRNTVLIGLTLILLLGAVTGVYFLTDYLIDDTALTLWIVICASLIALSIVVYASVAIAVYNSRRMLQDTMRAESRPILTYLGRVLTKQESTEIKAEAILNNMLLESAESKNLKMSLDTSKGGIMPYEELIEQEEKDPIIIIRPFIFANYGKSIAVGLNIALDGKMISYRSDYAMEPGAKIQLEINDTIKFGRGMKHFTMSYFDVYGYGYTVKLDGAVEYAQEESSDLERDVFFFYVDGFSI